MNIKGKLNQTCVYKLATAVDANQDRTFSAAVSIKCRVEGRLILVRGFDGDQVMSSHVIYSESPIPANALVFLPGDSGSDVATGRRVQQTLSSPGVNGKQYLYKTWVGSRE